MTLTFNRQKQVTAMTDQAGTNHRYFYDKLGRLINDTVYSVGSGVNTDINRLENGYNERSLLVRASSQLMNLAANPPALVNTLNEVAWDYNSFNQPVTEYQEHGKAVDKPTSLKVQYAWADGSSNTIRPTALTYPTASTIITTDYVSAMARDLSRPDAVKEGGSPLASLKYLGLGVVVDLKYDATTYAAELTMQNGGTGDAGDIYTGLDRFGRLVETIWKNTASAELVHTTYGRNRAGGITWQRNVLAHAAPLNLTTQDNFYWYDGLQQVTQHQRGNLTGTAPNYTGITNTQQSEGFSFDETGNWLSDSTTSPALNQTRTHNKANEIATLTGPAGVTAPVFSAVGNMTSLPKPGAWATGCTLTWDAWNRLISFSDGASTTTNKYDALTRRIQKTTTSPSGTRDYYYDLNWRAIEERVGGVVKAQYTWSPIDRWTLIRRKRSVSGTLDETRFVLKDYLDPAAVMDPASSTVDERYSYDAFGPVRVLDASFAQKSGNLSTCAWNFLFHAEFRDDDSGLYNYGFRFYNPDLGRWISRDPIGEKGGYNLYMMAKNDVGNSVDNLGLDSVTLRCGPAFSGFMHCGVRVQCGGKGTEYGIGGPDGATESQKAFKGLPPPEYPNSKGDGRNSPEKGGPDQKDYQVICDKSPCEVECCIKKIQATTNPPPYYALTQNSNSYAHSLLERCGCRFKPIPGTPRMVPNSGGRGNNSGFKKETPTITNPPKAWGW